MYLLRRLPLSSCYAYSPHGVGALSEQSRLAVNLVKSGDVSFLEVCAGIVFGRAAGDGVLAKVFCDRPVLVPIPGSGVQDDEDGWVSGRLCRAMMKHELGGAIWPVLHRARAVRKSATAGCKERPSLAAHYDSLRVETDSRCPGRLLLVDDIVTKGRTLLAAASRIREAFPDSCVSAFALVRTLRREETLAHLVEPCIGEIQCRWGDASRSP